MTMDGTYEDIDKAISSAYTPKDADIDYYLQVTASYTDPEGEGKTAMGTSANAVQGLRSDNNAPEFPDQDPDHVQRTNRQGKWPRTPQQVRPSATRLWPRTKTVTY